MCEPAHSIVQYNLQDDLSAQSNQTRIVHGLCELAAWGKQIGGYFHISCLGSGHTESIKWAKAKELYLPEEIRWEGNWWDRTFNLDSPIRTIPFGPYAEVEKAAQEYHNRVAMGTIQKFRNFLETSLRKTNRMAFYLPRLHDMFDVEASNLLFRKIKRLDFVKEKEQVISAIMGLTRKRKSFRAHFADDDKFWTPSSGQKTVLTT